MKTIHVLRALLVLVMVILPMMAATPTYADKGAHHQMVIPIDDDYIWYGDAPDNPCGFTIYVHEDGNLRINYWTDEEGRWIREMDIVGNLHRIAWVGNKTVNILIQGPIHYEYIYLPGNVLVVEGDGLGTSILTTAPGEGIILGGAGHFAETYTFDISDPENWILIDYSLEKAVGNGEDFTDFCNYMRP